MKKSIHAIQVQHTIVSLIPLCGFLLSGCAAGEKTYSAIINPRKNIAFNLSAVPLTQSSRLAGFLPRENRVVLVDSDTGEAIWGSSVGWTQGTQLPRAVRDGVVLQSDSKLSLLLTNGGQSTHTIEENYAVFNAQNETQFIANYNDRAEVINLLESNVEQKALTLRHAEELFPADPNGNRIDSRSSIYSFYSSALNSIVSVDLMLLKFFRYPAQGSDATGALTFNEANKTLCEASDLTRVRDSLLKKTQTDTETTYSVNPERIAFSFSLDFEQRGVLLRLLDGGLIYLDLESACAGNNAVRFFSASESIEFEESAKSIAIALPSENFAVQENEGTLGFYDASAEPIVKTGSVPDVCSETILGSKLYGKNLFILCGTWQDSEGFITARMSSAKIINIDSKKVIATFSDFQDTPVSGLGLKDLEPRLLLLGSSSLGRLTNLRITEDGAEVEVKKNTLLKNILDRL